MKSFVRSQRGMTLIEIMIAISILSVISVAVISLMKNIDKSSKSAQKAADIDGVMREIQTHMNNPENCSATVFGASGSTNTVITSLKEIDTRSTSNGALQAHPRLKASTLSSPSYLSPGLIINGMMLKFVSNTTTGANYELHVTFVKSVKAANSPTSKAADTFYGANYVSRKIPLQLDNCTRIIAIGNSQQAALGQCASATGTGSPVGSVVGIYSLPSAPDIANANAAGISTTQYAVGCRICPVGARSAVKGCL